MTVAVAICVCTYRRPEQLRRCLHSLEALALPADIDTRVVVVDNDPAASAVPTLRELSETLELNLSWEAEPRKGIPFARNRAVHAAGKVDFFAFIDDDETAAQDWLAELLRVQAENQADVVAGPVVSVREGDPPQWWTLLNQPTDHRDGQRVQVARTGNLLVSSGPLLEYEGPFNTRLAAIGSSDTELFLRMGVDGAHMFYCATAKVYEHIPPQRMTLRWMARRRLRGHSTWALLEHNILNVSRLSRLGKSTARIVQGIATILWGLVTLKRRPVYAGVLNTLSGVGGILGSFGYAFEEYGAEAGRRHGPVRVTIGR